jgi:hypothetical protein
MKDMQAHLEKLCADAAECKLISDLATDRKKQELFARLAQHLSVLASEVESAIAQAGRQSDSSRPPAQDWNAQLERDQRLRVDPAEKLPSQ